MISDERSGAKREIWHIFRVDHRRRPQGPRQHAPAAQSQCRRQDRADFVSSAWPPFARRLWLPLHGRNHLAGAVCNCGGPVGEAQ